MSRDKHPNLKDMFANCKPLTEEELKEAIKAMSRDKQINDMAKDLSEASRLASKRLVDETRSFVKEKHRYHSKNDFDKAHSKTMSELEAEYLIDKGYRKASEIARKIFEEIENEIKNHGICYAHRKIAELKKKYESEKDNGEV